MNCPSCNKFAALEMQEPEVQSIDVDQDGQVSCEVRIVRNSECCGDEMKDASLSMETVAQGLCKCQERELTIAEEDIEIIEESGGRYAKSFYGATVNAVVTCEKCKKTWDVIMTDKVAASDMEELN